MRIYELRLQLIEHSERGLKFCAEKTLERDMNYEYVLAKYIEMTNTIEKKNEKGSDD